MDVLKLEQSILSGLDKTRKFIFTTNDGKVLEVSYINKNDGKDIICVPTQSGCSQGCLFCHMTGSDIPVVNLTAQEITESVLRVRKLLKLSDEKPLLVSYMGCGEPLHNYDIIFSMELLSVRVPRVRFALATIMPELSEETFVKMTKFIKFHELDLKIHLSLHFVVDELRKKWLPNAADILPSLHLLRWYRDYTGNKIEIHYTPIKGVNDSVLDAGALYNLTSDIPLKLLTFNPKPGLLSEGTDDIEKFKSMYGGSVEIYTPPGRDIGASCGQFDISFYKSHGKS